MVISRRVAKRKGQSLVALSREVKERLGVIPGQWLYFHLGRLGEVVISPNAARADGPAVSPELEAQLVAALARVDRLSRREQGRDRAMYAEGYALGRQDGEDIVMRPHGARANALRRRRLAQDAWGARVIGAAVLAEAEGARVAEVRDPLTDDLLVAVPSGGGVLDWPG